MFSVLDIGVQFAWSLESIASANFLPIYDVFLGLKNLPYGLFAAAEDINRDEGAVT